MINIFNIERFATHDGPGIRSVVFLKGCPLHCPWCANPESWDVEPQVLYSKEKCTNCQLCATVCPTNAISFVNDRFTYDKEKCNACKACEHACTQEAIEITGKKVNIQEVMDVVLKDVDYYNQSNGGITISGGEPFNQSEELFTLVQACKKEELHVAIETTGYTSLENIKKVEPFTDLFLFDIKHTNMEKLKKITGAHLEIILENLIYLTQKDANKVIIRVPVIPLFNFCEERIKEIIDLAYSIKVKEVHLLAYHTLGENKWDKIMKQYYSNEPMVRKEDLVPYIAYGESLGITIKIGG